MARLGVVFTAKRAIPDLPEAARRAEALGYDELWLVEDCFAYGGLTAAAAALAATQRLRVGIGLLPASVRNPAIGAMEIATVAGLHPGRLDVAFGHGVESWMRQIGARPPDRIAALRHVLRTTGALLRGETVENDVALEQPPPQPPGLFVGTTGEKAIGVARECGAGVLLPEGSGTAAIEWVRGLLGGGPVVSYAWLSVDADGDAARERLEPVVAAWREWGLYPNLGEPFAVAGTPEECAQAVAGLGADSVALVPVGDPDEQFTRFMGAR
jgi:alkanesulfonate monooxygenase SsuD/methylene tetrahydromethanopterin reductase-like flavin-dependent oxidoreductase (luciferase family)